MNRSPDEAKLNPGQRASGRAAPDCASLHPGYAFRTRPRHCEERSDEAIQSCARLPWIPDSALRAASE
jgi:hypothetical protein